MSDGELVEVEPYEVSPALLAQENAEYDRQIATAKKYPRSTRQFLQEATELACLDEDSAGECMYGLSRGGKRIEGPSARLSEILAYAWGNCRAQARVIEVGERFVTAQGAFFDVEKNVAIAYEVQRRITNKHGQRFNDDMITVTSNAACSIALRNAILKGIPRAVWRPVYQRARLTAVGDQSTLAERRSQMLAAFAKQGTQPETIFTHLGYKGEEDITLDDLAYLRGVFTAIRDNEISPDNAFAVARDQPDSEPAPARKSDLNETLGRKTGDKQPETAPPADEPEKQPEPVDHAEQLRLIYKSLDAATTQVGAKKVVQDAVATGRLTDEEVEALNMQLDVKIDDLRQERAAKKDQGSLLGAEGESDG